MCQSLTTDTYILQNITVSKKQRNTQKSFLLAFWCVVAINSQGRYIVNMSQANPSALLVFAHTDLAFNWSI